MLEWALCNVVFEKGTGGVDFQEGKKGLTFACSDSDEQKKGHIDHDHLLSQQLSLQYVPPNEALV